MCIAEPIPASTNSAFVPPQDLLAHFPGGWAIRTSLKTSDLKEANAKAKALHAPSGMLVLRPCAQANRAR